MSPLRPLLIAALLAAVVSSPAQQSEGHRYFSLSSNSVVQPGANARVQVNTSDGVRELEFRLYRVNDAKTFWRGLDEENRFGGIPRRRGRARTWLERYVAWRASIRGALSDTVRYQFSPANRASIRAFLDKPAEPKPRTVAKGRTYADVPVLNSQQLVRSWRQPVVKRRSWENLTVDVPLADAGLYVLEATDGTLNAYTVLNASNLALITKAFKGRILTRAVDATSGAPQPGIEVTFIDSRERRDMASVRTNADGIAETSVEQPVEEGVRLIACRERHCALAHVQGWPLGVAESRELTGLVYTDRPVYRPGHTVHYRALTLRPAPSARIEVQNPQGEPVARREGSFSKWGTVAGDVDLPKDAIPGYYSVELKSGEGTIYGGFQVEEYRKPEYEVRVTPAEKRILQGAKASVTIQARYYYGEPVKGARVKYAVRKARAWLWFDPDWADDDAGGEEEAYAGGTEQIDEKEARLDEDGKLTVEVAAAADDYDMRYVVDARVTDSSGREISGLGGFMASRGNFLLRVRPTGFVYQPGSPVEVEVRAYDFEGNPAGNLDVSVILKENLYGDDAQKRRAWTTTFSTRLNAEGRGSIKFPAPDSGSYQLEATAKGTRVTGTSYLWVSGGLNWSSGEGAEVRIVPDKAMYKAGDTAKLLIVSGAPGAHLWLSVEGRTLFWSKFLITRSAAETIQIPVTQDWEPNVFVEASLLRDRKFSRGSKLLKVPASRRKLAVALQPDKPQYLPGETATIELTATDHQGKPVQGEFSVGVVDEPIYAIQPDTTPDLMQVFHARQWNRVSTDNSLDFYFYGESGKRRMLLAGTRPPGVRGQLKPPAPLQPKIRKLFPDTAFWSASLVTNSSGKGRVSFPWPDALTTWRTTARGISTGERVGNATIKTIVRKNLMLSLATPRFLTVGDQAALPVIVRNYYDTAQPVELSLNLSGAQMGAPLPGRMEVPPHGEAVAPASISATGGTEVRFLAKALNKVESDALELTVPLLPQGLKLQGAHTLTTDSKGASFSFGFPQTAMPGTRHLRLTLTPSLASAVYGGLEYLVEYPYGCTEQTMSALLPALLVSEAVKELKLPPPVAPAELKRKVESGVDRLTMFQHPDGGWGWWRGDDSHPFLTAYVAMGLQTARQQGFTVRDDVWTKGRSALERQVDGRRLEPDVEAWSLYALSLMKQATPTRRDGLFSRRAQLSPWGLALLGLALVESGDARSASVAGELTGLVRRSDTGSHWSATRDPMFDEPSDFSLEATAFALRFLSQADPASPLLPEAARWLLENRKRGYYWDTTKRTALVILGLTRYLASSGELKPDYSATVFVNDRKTIERSFTAADALSVRPFLVEVPEADLKPENRVRVELNGNGRLSLAANWGWRTLTVPPAIPEGNGLAIRREYYVLKPERSGGKVTWTPVPVTGDERPGDLIGVRLIVTAEKSQSYMLIEDPIPAGSEIVTREDLYELTRGRELSRSWWSRREERDDRVSFFPSRLPRGETTYSYLLKLTHAGRFVVPPARVEPMYSPGVVSATQQGLLEVKP